MTLSSVSCGQLSLLESTTTSDALLQPTLSQAILGQKSIKWCSGCKQEVDQSNFYKYNGSWDGLQPYCKDCQKQYSKHYQKAKKSAPPKTPCRICGSEEQLRMDHDHVSGNFRGWLCHRHNVAIGLLNDSIDELHQVIHYLSTKH